MIEDKNLLVLFANKKKLIKKRKICYNICKVILSTYIKTFENTTVLKQLP